jgi:hypothetical protein
MKHLGIFCLLLSLIATSAHSLGNDTISLQKQDIASKELQKLFEAKGQKGLPALTSDPDMMVALHAAWENGKGDKKKTGEFLSTFKDKLKVKPPEWWQERLKEVVVYKTCHSFGGVDSSKLKDAARFSDDRYDVVTNPTKAGFSYTVEVADRESKKVLWKGDIWAAGRTFLAGEGVHQIELVVSDGRLFVFGAESHGAYAEAFNLKDGTPLLRFCTCYWFNFSEEWELK